MASEAASETSAGNIPGGQPENPTDIKDFKVKTMQGEEIRVGSYLEGVKAALVVNVASKCGYTPQYKGLQQLYEKFKDRGFTILGFPCNQFMGQEPGNDDEIKEFACSRFKVSFPLFSKIDVNGKHAHPLYEYMKKECPGFMGTKAVKWNFSKFLIDKNGKVVKRYSSNDTPESIEKDIETYFKE